MSAPPSASPIPSIPPTPSTRKKNRTNYDYIFGLHGDFLKERIFYTLGGDVMHYQLIGNGIRQELHVADQMGQAELDPHIAEVQVFAVGREIVAAQQAVEFRAQQLQEHLRAAGLVDLEVGEERGSQAPGPEGLPLFLCPVSSTLSRA